MFCKKMFTKKFLVGAVCGAILSAAILVGCTGDTKPEGGRDIDRAEVTQVMPERGGSESGGEHGGATAGTEGGGEHGGSGGESGREGAEGSGGGAGGAAPGEDGSGANALILNETFDMVRGDARLIMNYDAASNSFIGTVENTTNNILNQVSIEIHLSNGTELGPTAPIDLAPGEVVNVKLPATAAPFTGWTPHAEVGGDEHDSSGGGESGGEGGAESGEAAMSSPTIPLGHSWNGVLGGLAVSAQYDGTTQSVHTTVQNTLSQTLCYVQAEPHLKSGTTTVGELGPDMLGDLNPGQQATSILAVASEPNLAGVAYDVYVVHMEVFDCAGPGPMPHTGGEGAEGSGGEGAESGGGEGNAEHGGSGAEGSESGGETGAATGEEGSGANTLALNETFDMVRSGARLILNYDAASNAFIGTVENTTNNVLDRVRIEVHLTNGTELGPTTPINLAPGEVAMVILPARAAAFDGWVAHAEVGGGGQGSEAGGEHGSDGGDAQGSESSGEGGEGGGGESGSEHDGRNEAGGEHGNRGERPGRG